MTAGVKIIARPVRTLRILAALVALRFGSGSMNLNDYFTRSERIKRLGELLAKGITLMVFREAEEKRKANFIPSATAAVLQAERIVGCDETPSAIIRYIERIGSASPRDVQRGLDLPKTTAFRHLDRLTKAGIISRTG